MLSADLYCYGECKAILLRAGPLSSAPAGLGRRCQTFHKRPGAPMAGDAEGGAPYGKPIRGSLTRRGLRRRGGRAHRKRLAESRACRNRVASIDQSIRPRGRRPSTERHRGHRGPARTLLRHPSLLHFREVLMYGPETPAIRTLADLRGRRIGKLSGPSLRILLAAERDTASSRCP